MSLSGVSASFMANFFVVNELLRPKHVQGAGHPKEWVGADVFSAEELDAIMRKAAEVGALTAILAMQDDTSVLVYLQLSNASMEPF